MNVICRSFGRAPRSVQLEGSFVPYDADILPEEDTKTLVSRPYFHIYWTDCVSHNIRTSVPKIQRCLTIVHFL